MDILSLPSSKGSCSCSCYTEDELFERDQEKWINVNGRLKIGKMIQLVLSGTSGSRKTLRMCNMTQENVQMRTV